jgi:hypothetical protein
LDKEKALKAKKDQQEFGIIKTINCNRPVSTGNCRCRDGVVCWPCIWAGAAVLLIIASIFIYRAWRKRNPRQPLVR